MNLNYAVEWGGQSWLELVKQGLSYIGEIQNKSVLDCGTRYGKMACYFALQGANVTAFDKSKDYLEVAKSEADKWNVKVNWVNSSIDNLPDDSFDIIFSKSFICMTDDTISTIDKIHSKLKNNGKILFIENAKGSIIQRSIRRLRHPKWNYSYVNYFTSKELEHIKKLFNIDNLLVNFLPPIFLITGRKK